MDHFRPLPSLRTWRVSFHRPHLPRVVAWRSSSPATPYRPPLRLSLHRHQYKMFSPLSHHQLPFHRLHSLKKCSFPPRRTFHRQPSFRRLRPFPSRSRRPLLLHSQIRQSRLLRALCPSRSTLNQSGCQRPIRSLPPKRMVLLQYTPFRAVPTPSVHHLLPPDHSTEMPSIIHLL